jgi:N-acyl-D-aspartate/D-glutamate deacylase
MIFQGNWDRVMVRCAQAAKRQVRQPLRCEIAQAEHRDPLDVMLDLALDENLETAFLGRFLNVGDDGVARAAEARGGVVALSDAAARTSSICATRASACISCAAGCASAATSTIGEGIRRLTIHPADLYGIPNRGRLVVGAQADLLLFDPATVGVSPAERVADLPGRRHGRTIRRADRRAWRVLQRRS